MPGRRNNLGNALRERYARKGDMVDLERAIAVWEKAVQQTPHGSPSWPTYVSSLGNGLRDRYASKGNLADLERAIAIWEKAIEQVPPGSPDLPALLNNLGAGLRDRYGRSGDPIDLERAVAAFADACQSGIAVTSEPVLRAARTWGNWALERKTWAEAVQAYTYGLEASEHLFQAQLLRTYKEAWLREVQGLHARAAYALAQAFDLPRAVATLEQGRARLLSQVLERDRADLEQLRMLAPAVYDQYVAATHRLQVLEAQDISGLIALPPGQGLADILHHPDPNLANALHAVRPLPPPQTFLP